MQIGNTGFWIRDCTTEPENGGLGVFAHAGAGATGTYVLGPAEHATKKAQALVVELPADARGNARSSIAGNRQHLGLDTTLAEGPYNFGWGLTRPDGERSPYQDGLLVSYAVARGGRTAPAPAAPDWSVLSDDPPMSSADGCGHTGMPTITPCLWFDGTAEQAANHYVSIFPNSRITGVSHYNEADPAKAGQVLTVEFELDGQPFQGLNGGPEFTFTPALSLSIDCADQAEVDHYWSHLTEGGEELPCGWVTDRFGVPWQVVPRRLPELLAQGGETAKRVMECMYTMKKLDVAALEEAAGVPA